MKKSRFLAAITVLSVAGAVAALPAFAQTTEEQLQQVLRQFQAQQKAFAAQQKAFEALSQEVDRLKKAATASAAQASKVAASAAAAAKEKESAPSGLRVKSGNEKVTLTLKGQVNRAFMVVDDGKQSEGFHVDNDFSSTRFSLLAEAKPNKDLKIGGLIEMELQSNASNKVTMDQSSTGSTSLTERIIDVYFDSSKYGRLTMGQGKMASDGTSQLDLSGTGVIALSKIHGLAGDIRFRQKDATGTQGPSVDTVYNNMDGLGREDRIRYDTPKFNGFQASISHGDGGEADFALRHTATIDGIKTKAALAYANSSSVDDHKQINGSVSVLFPVGLNFTFASGTQAPDMQLAGESDPMFWWGKIGWQTRLVSWGKTAFSIDYGQADDLGAQGDEFQSVGGAIVQRLDDYGTEIFLSGRNYSLDQPGMTYHDIFAVVSGARIKF